MRPYNLEPIIRIRIPAPDGGEPRTYRRQPHPPSVVAQAKALVETTTSPLKAIARRVNINSGLLSRWVQKHGWTRPPGAPKLCPRPERRWVPVVQGRVLANRLRAQAERLIQEIEAAPRVDVKRLAEAQRILREARAEYHRPRPHKLQPPPPLTPDEEAERARRQREARAEARRRGWQTRRARRDFYRAWMMEKIDK